VAESERCGGGRELVRLGLASLSLTRTRWAGSPRPRPTRLQHPPAHPTDPPERSAGPAATPTSPASTRTASRCPARRTASAPRRTPSTARSAQAAGCVHALSRPLLAVPPHQPGLISRAGDRGGDILCQRACCSCALVWLPRGSTRSPTGSGRDADMVLLLAPPSPLARPLAGRVLQQAPRLAAPPRPHGAQGRRADPGAGRKAVRRALPRRGSLMGRRVRCALPPSLPSSSRIRAKS